MESTQAWEDDVRVGGYTAHPTDASRVAIITAAIRAAERWPADMPPVLVVEDDGNGIRILDGHHRMAAAHLCGLQGVPALVVALDWYATVEAAREDGEDWQAADLDEYIICPDGLPYRARA